MPNAITGTVEGTAEVNSAIKAVAGFDQIKAANRAIEAIIPYVKAGSRMLTGTMAGAWMARDAAFYNQVEYAPYQEFGTVYVEPTHAIQAAWDGHSAEVTEAYSEEIDSAISEAGFRP